MDKMGFSLQKERIFKAPIKLAQPFPAPELQTKHFMDTRMFLRRKFALSSLIGVNSVLFLCVCSGTRSAGPVQWDFPQPRGPKDRKQTFSFDRFRKTIPPRTKKGLKPCGSAQP